MIAVTNVSSAPVKLEVCSHVKLVQDPNRHGVVRWMGTLPEIHDTIAGVELVSCTVQSLVITSYIFMKTILSMSD